MREVPKKNYIVLLVMILLVITVTLLLVNAYNNRDKKTSTIYNFLPEIKTNELDSYLFENPSIIIYISDKYNLDNEEIEIKMQNKITELNVYNYFVYLDINNIDSEFLENFNKKYDASINITKIPMLIVINDGKVINSYYNIDELNINDLVGDIK